MLNINRQQMRSTNNAASSARRLQVSLILSTCLPLAIVNLNANAANLQLDVQDATGAPLADAVVYAEAINPGNLAKPSKVIQIEQIGRKYQPLVTALQLGSQVSFPNNDTVRHHVYSFSAAKKFEMKLYSGVPSENVLFDKTGTVVLGCNIHDKMIAYIHVVDTPFFSKTDAQGKAQLAHLPAGKYRLKAWHYNVPQNAGITEQALQMGSDTKSLQLKLATKAGAAPANSATSSTSAAAATNNDNY